MTQKRKTNKDLRIIGRKEVINFPDLELFEIDAKVDTGAYTSSIHCTGVKSKMIEGKKMVSFYLLDKDHPAYDHKLFTLPVFKFKRVKSSMGHTEYRYIIKTNIEMFHEKFEVELSLADRSKMEHPVLIGRKMLKNKFLVDVSRVNLSNIKHHKKKLNK